MRAAVFKGGGVVELEEVPEPVVERGDDVIIDVEACGICGTDLQILNVPPGHPADAGVVMGHEFIGRVSALGADVDGLRVGQRVTVDPDPKCGVCGPCRAGRPASCENVQRAGHLPRRRARPVRQGAGRRRLPAVRRAVQPGSRR